MHQLDLLIAACVTLKILTIYVFKTGMGHQRAKDASCMGGQGA